MNEWESFILVTAGALAGGGFAGMLMYLVTARVVERMKCELEAQIAAHKDIQLHWDSNLNLKVIQLGTKVRNLEALVANTRDHLEHHLYPIDGAHAATDVHPDDETTQEEIAIIHRARDDFGGAA